jgi:YbbR domain-containing protein
VRRIIRRIFNNWPLKLAAVGLATLMYGGLALSQNTQLYPGQIPVHYVNEPADTVKLPSTPGPVDGIRYFAPSGVLVAASSFLATIDLADYEGKVGVFQVPISVISPDPRVRVLGFFPQFATIQLDSLVSRADVPVKVVHGPVPEGLTLGEITVVPETVTISGAAALVSQVDSVRADVAIPSGGIDGDEDVRLVPVDKLGNTLIPIEVTPATARVTIAVISDLQSKTVPVNAIVTGTPAAGFEIESVTVAPQVALVAGDASDLEALARVDTEPVPLAGVSDDLTVRVDLALPTGVVPVDASPVTVSIKVRPVTGTRNFSAGLRLVGANNTLSYALSVDRVLVTIGGSTADLDRLSGAALVMDLDVSGLKTGKHEVTPTASLPVGTTLVAVSPPTVVVTIGAAGAATPSGAASPQPGG